MLPLLPALILLFLQGPANIERMASVGQLPGALNALHRQMATPHKRVRPADEVVLASLLAVSGDRELSEALWQLLSLTSTTNPEIKPVVVFDQEHSPPIPIPPSLGQLQDGYVDGRRSRDGPDDFRS
jgi:hypothetical protein